MYARDRNAKSDSGIFTFNIVWRVALTTEGATVICILVRKRVDELHTSLVASMIASRFNY